nr:VWA domain-containing protein [uncultured Blautia sp.]
MEVTYVDSSMENYIKGMMEKKLPTDNTLGDYFLYNIQFKVNGEAKESLEPITITFEKSNLEIKDTKKANVFFFDPANPEVSGDKDELVEITQRSELLESLQAAGQSTATMEEDYDLSSIEIKEENRSGKIVLEGRKSTIYGCYVEKEPEQIPETPAEQPEEKPADIPVLNYEDDQVTVSVTAEEAGVIPEGAELRVLPITSEDAETKTQYEEVEKKIQEKVAEEEKEVAGFLAYDITFVDKDGNKMEPNGKVKVSMDYKKAELPQEVLEKEATDAEVTVLHLEEDENGEVKQVVDMGAEQKANVDTLISTEGTKVQNVEVETESFSVFTITWKYVDNKSEQWDKIFTITAHYGYVDERNQWVEFKGNEMSYKPKSFAFNGANQTLDLTTDDYRVTIPGYEYSKTIVDQYNNSIEIKKLETKKDRKSSQYYINYITPNNSSPKWLKDGDKTEGEIYFVYEKDSSSGGSTGGSSATGNLAHKKYVTDNGDGTYDLTLDVVGAVGTETNPAEVDIVFVLDVSGSMDGANIENAKSAVKTLTENLKSNQTVDSKWKLVTFSSGASVETENWVSAEDIDNMIQKYNDKSCSGGTNYQAGLTTAGDVLKTARTDSVKIVIFLTDGEPTYHGINSEGGGSLTSQDDYDGALTGAGNITCDRFYAVGMGLKDKIGIHEREKVNEILGIPIYGWVEKSSMTGIQLLEEVANKTNSQHKQAINVGAGDSLDAVFSEISGSITRYVASNVTITDELTEEVDLVDSRGEVTTNPNDLTIKVLDANKRDVTGIEVSAGSITASYNAQIKQIQLNFADNYELKEGYTYSVTAKIKLNDQAKEKYKENNYSYPDTGEAGTGDTSTGEKGFFSNVADSAKVTWTANGEVKEGKYNRPVVQIPNDDIPVRLKKEPVNFFLNLTSSILDTNGQIGGQSEDAFTTSVSGSFSGDDKNSQGIGVPINADLMVVVPKDHVHENLTGVYGVIGGTSNTNAKNVDEKIRKLGEELGTNGNQAGTEDEWYRIVNGNDESAFPTDEEIFTYIKTYWNSPETGVNKNQNITINGNPIDKDKLTTENFAIRWYVFKDQTNGEYWHIDGILVPKSGVLTITKTFPNQEVVDAVKDTFTINITGDFLGTTDNTTITKGLSEAGEPTINDDGTVTYKWELAVFGEKYNVEEIGYETALNSNWKYLSTQWTYTDASGHMSEGATTSCDVNTERTAEDETPKKQTLALTNRYELANISIDLMKFGTTYDNPLAGAKFELYRGSEDYLTVKWEENPEQKITVVNDNSLKELDLPEGYYKLKEVLAPTGYQLLGKDICFKIENRVVTLIDAAGNALESGNTEMWTLERDNTNGFVLKIKNEALYELPSTGGTGIFVYTIGGTLLLMAAALLIYKMKREEVLKG